MLFILDPVLVEPTGESFQDAQLAVSLSRIKPPAVPDARRIPCKLLDVANQVSAFFSSLLAPYPGLRTCARQLAAADFLPPPMLCVDCMSLLAWVPPSGPSFSPTSVAFWPLPGRVWHPVPVLPLSCCILDLARHLTYCIIRITFMGSSLLRSDEFQGAEIIFSISFYLQYPALCTDLFNMYFLSK